MMTVTEIANLLKNKGFDYFVYADNPPTNIYVGDINKNKKIEIKNNPNFVYVWDYSLAEVANEIAKSNHAILFLNNQKFADYTKTMLSLNAANKPEMVVCKKEQPQTSFDIDFFQKIKERLGKEIPEIMLGIQDHFGEDLKPEVKNQLQQIVESTVMTTAIQVIRFIEDIFKEQENVI